MVWSPCNLKSKKNSQIFFVLSKILSGVEHDKETFFSVFSLVFSKKFFYKNRKKRLNYYVTRFIVFFLSTKKAIFFLKNFQVQRSFQIFEEIFRVITLTVKVLDIFRKTDFFLILFDFFLNFDSNFDPNLFQFSANIYSNFRRIFRRIRPK